MGDIERIERLGAAYSANRLVQGKPQDQEGRKRERGQEGSEPAEPPQDKVELHLEATEAEPTEPKPQPKEVEGHVDIAC